MFKTIKNYFKKRSYEKYIQSKEWKNLRNKIIKRDGGKCFLCDKTEKLEVHHLFYEKDLFKTKPYQCVTLCKKHHKKLHKKINTTIYV